MRTQAYRCRSCDHVGDPSEWAARSGACPKCGSTKTEALVSKRDAAKESSPEDDMQLLMEVPDERANLTG